MEKNFEEFGIEILVKNCMDEWLKPLKKGTFFLQTELVEGTYEILKEKSEELYEHLFSEDPYIYTDSVIYDKEEKGEIEGMTVFEAEIYCKC